MLEKQAQQELEEGDLVTAASRLAEARELSSIPQAVVWKTSIVSVEWLARLRGGTVEPDGQLVALEAALEERRNQCEQHLRSAREALASGRIEDVIASIRRAHGVNREDPRMADLDRALADLKSFWPRLENLAQQVRERNFKASHDEWCRVMEEAQHSRLVLALAVELGIASERGRVSSALAEGDVDGAQQALNELKRTLEYGRDRESNAVLTQLNWHIIQCWREILFASVIVLQENPDPAYVTDSRLYEAIKASGLPWRIRHRLTGIEMVLIPAGEYMRGSSEEDREASSNERPQHSVTISKPFYLSVYEVTQAEWMRVMTANPSHFKGERLPVEQVSWNDVQEFVGKANGLRLPTEGEWEYACRAGTSGARYGRLEDSAWYSGNSGGATHPVGGKAANALGLHDMLGNVWEWCGDSFGAYSGTSLVDPVESGGPYRVVRGGSWDLNSGYCRSAIRDNDGPGNTINNLGFRVVLAPVL